VADRLLTRPAALPLTLRIAMIYLAARAVTTILLLIAAELSTAQSRFGADASIASLSMGWDGQWYWLVATEGYPTTLPVDDAGVVVNNAWAFLPVYPVVSRALAAVVGSYPLAAIAVSVLAGYVACVALYRLLAGRLDDAAAMWAVALFAAGPLGALFQMGYAESLFLMMLLLALRCLQRRSFGWLYLLVPLMGFTRPGVLAFSLMLAGYGIARWVRRRADPLPLREAAHIVALGLLAAAVGLSWQLIAAVATGDPAAYLETELSWRRGWTGDVEGGFTPLSGFVEAAALWFSLWGLPAELGYVALAVGVAAVAAALLLIPAVRRLGPEVRLWSASYVVYLLLVFFPQSSIFRLLLPLAPLYGALAAPRWTAWRLGMLALGLLGQWWWIYNMLALGNTYFQIP
jgi:hypothetical protein